MKDFQIIGDSGLDADRALIERLALTLVPLSITVDDTTYIDDDTLSSPALMAAIAASKSMPKSACPSPMDFLEQYKNGKESFVVTLSSALSGSYNSAMVAKELFLSECKDRLVHVFDSKSASAGELLVAMKIRELVEKKVSFDGIVEQVTRFIGGMRTMFVLDSLDVLRKSGRISRMAASLAGILSIRLVMGDNGAGEIKLLEKVRGMRQALDKMVELLPAGLKNPEVLRERTLIIAHCNMPERAEYVREAARRFSFKEIVVVATRGIASMYAGNGGVVVSY